MMHIDPFTAFIFHILISFAMSAGLFIVSRHYLNDTKSLRLWATALLVQGIGWSMGLIGEEIVPKILPLLSLIGVLFVIAGDCCYFHALARFKKIFVPLRWTYLLFILSIISQVYFTFIKVNFAAKAASSSLSIAVVFFACSFLLFRKLRHKGCPISHRLTGSIFALGGCVGIIRTAYYGFWQTNIAAGQAIFEVNWIQNLTHLTIDSLTVLTSLGFVLMCNDKFLAEHRQAQLAHQESSDRLTKIAGRIPGVVYQFKMAADGQFSVPYCSDGTYFIFRLRPQQIYEDVTQVFKRVHPEDLQGFMESIYQSAQDLSHWKHEFRVQFEDGSIRWLSGNAAPQRKPDAAIVWHGFITDITERKLMEEELRIRNQELEHYFNQPFIGMLTANHQKKTLHINQRLCEMVGYSQEEMQILDWGKITYPEDLPRNQAYLEQAIRGEIDSYQMEKRYIHKDGHIVYVDLAVQCVRSPNGEPEYFIGMMLDITERKQAELALRASEQKYQSLVDDIGDKFVIYSHDVSGELLYISDGISSVMGISKEQALGKNWIALFDWLPGEIETGVYYHRQLIDEKANFVQFEMSFNHPDGKGHTIQISAHSVRNENGEIVTLDGIVEDITERKQTEKKLALNNKRLTALIEAIPDAIFFKDGKSHWLITNEPAKQLFKLHDIPWQGKSEMELADLHPEFRAAHEACLVGDEQAWANRKLTLLTEKVADADGQLHEFEVRKLPVFNEQGERQALVIIGRDVSELRQAEKELEQLSVFQQILMELAAGYINLPLANLDLMLNTSLRKIGRFIQADRAYIFDYDFDRQLTSNTHEWCAAGINPEIDNLQNIPLASIPDWVKTHLLGQSLYIADVLSLPAGNLRDILQPQGIKSLLAIPLIQGKHCLGFVGFDSVKNHRTYSSKEMHLLSMFAQMLVNVKLRKQMEELLYAAKEAALAASQAKSEFLANMSHEIRTPMNAILGFSNILADLITDKTHRYYLNAIQSSGKTLLQLINDILDLSKIEAGKLEIIYNPVNIRSVFNDIYLIFSQKLTEKNTAFKLSISPDLPSDLLLDEIRLRQIMLNLIGNAVKFTHQGEIFVEVSGQITANANEIALTIKVTDSGIGIKSDQLENIFAAFTQQVEQNTQYGGTGLGLTICKRLVEMMSGTITVTSQVHIGSCFTVYLPHVEVCAKSQEQPKQQTRQNFTVKHFQPATLLLVDDIETNRDLIKSYLQDYPELNLVEAETGTQALEQVKQQAFDLLLMDKRLPDIDGEQVCGEIRLIPDYADIPIIMITASAVQFEHQAISPLYNIELHKPVTKNALLVAMQSLLPVNEALQVADETITETLISSLSEDPLSPEKRAQLVELLNGVYPMQINRLMNGGALPVDDLIEMAEELEKIASNYHCQLLKDWAETLKSQAELFDLDNLPKTLNGFNDLITQLDEVKKL